ncbi:MAG: hypothetical protein L0Y56_04815 [Nitrospira sp.]|nr:hypothetical protein [Nitrospira sp.]
METNQPIGMGTRIILSVAIVIIDWVAFFVPLGSLFLAYVILTNPPWVRDFLNQLNGKHTE